MKRRGFVFTLDAILGLLLITLFVVSMAQINPDTQVYSTYMRSQSKYVAEDTLTTFRTVPLKDLVPPEKIEEWMDDGTLNTTLVSPDMSPLDIVATYWAAEPVYPSADLRHKAEVIMGYLLNSTLKDYNYELLINNYTSPYLRKVGANYSSAEDVSPATLILSGYAYNQTPRGYMARAYLTKATTTREDLFGWFRVLAGAYYGDNTLTISRTITLPSDAKVVEADGKFVARYDERIDLYINSEPVDLGYEQINKDNLTNYLHGGDNAVTLVFSEPTGNEIGSASGTTMYVKYRTNSTSVEDPGIVKVYDVTSEYTGIMYLLETFVPGNITSIDMRFKVHNVGEVRLYYGLGGNLALLLTKTANSNGDAVVEFTDDEIRSALRDMGVTYENLSKMVFDFVLGFDALYWQGDWYYEGQDYGLERERRIYGYPESYVRIGYIPKTVVTPYSIPLSIFKDYDDIQYRDCHYDGDYWVCSRMSVSYPLPPGSTPWYADYWVGYVFDYSTVQELWENGRMFYSGPLGMYAIRVAYTRLYDWMMVPGQENEFEIGMENGNSYVRNGETRGIIRYFIEGYAGYGDVFPYLLQGYPAYKGYNLTYYSSISGEKTILVGDEPYRRIQVEELDPGRYAVDDAILRLLDKLNFRDDQNPEEWKETPYDGSRQNPIDVGLPASVRMDFASMGNVPGLFQPITITLRVWRES
ncbi:hypothetical protein A3L12_03200 [Thermococcus sp. P6]|uniref:hypothetical protein n=1 Tax=Thermococcus sp. P6 TaxID=122420 RepID=UPI000B59851E|nr:hypothetical protein [Thermococcus sp. P6]ASJ10375.1 hypothetical protein A3L12_03200 [Thermococcus sp. P6]